MKKHKKQNVVIKNIKFILPILLKKSPQTIFIMIINALLSSVLSLLNIIMPAKIIEELIGNRSQEVLLWYVVFYAGGAFVISSVRAIANWAQDYYSNKASLYIDELLSDKITRVDFHNIEDPGFIDLLNRAKKGMNQYSGGIYNFIYSLSNIIGAIIRISGVITIVFFSGQYLLLILSLISLISNQILYRKIQNTNQDFRNHMIRSDRQLYYYNKNIASFRLQKELRLYQCQKLMTDISKDLHPKVFRKYKALTKKLIKLNTIDNVIYNLITQFLTILVLGYATIKDPVTMTISTFTLLWRSINTFDTSIADLIYFCNDYYKACEYQSDFIDLLSIESQFKDGIVPIDHLDNIEFRNVSFKYPRTDKYILRNVSFKIGNKEKVSLVGLNGAGKTTIIKLLCRFYKVEEGEILVNGININEYDYDQYMQQLSIVFQDFKIISFMVKSNIAIVDENKEKLDDCLKRAQVYDKVQSLPKKEYTYVNKWFDKTGVEFSGGEMQKFALARALYKESDLVILDEPTSALDPIAEAEIYYHFKDIVGKKLSIFISHRLSSCIFSDKIMVVDGNQIVEEGTHQELMQNKNGLYKKMFDAQAAYYQE